VLVLAPEVYLPLRNVGTHFHASADGLAAADKAFEFLDETVDERPRSGAAPSLPGATVSLRGFGVAAADGRLAPADLSFAASPGAVTVLVGPNGEGKSTALAALAGLIKPDAGSVEAGGVTLATAQECVDDESWTSQCAWVPQRPDLGPEGRVLSLGQRQMRALTRAFESDRPVLLLDEPTAHLDREGRASVIAAIAAAAAAGRTVVVTTHEPELIDAATQVVTVTAGVSA